MTFTWKQAAEIAKQLKIKYQLPIFAMSFEDSCSCCAEPSNLNKGAYLTLDVKDKSWSEIESYIIFNNACNSSGEVDMDDEFSVTYNDIFNEKSYSKQYIKYKLSDNFTKEKLEKCLTEFVDAVNKESFTTYELSVPKYPSLCATIEKI